jgi:flagellar biosynthesis/type III secretory pathway protein FliH
VTGGTLFDTQIVVTGRLDPETHSSLRLLSKNVQTEDVRRFLSESEALSAPGDKNNVDAVLEVSISANGSVYEKIKEDLHMCEALEKLMQKEIDEKVSEGKAAGIAEGIAEGKAVGIAEGKTAGKLAALTELVKDGILTVSDAAKRANMTEAVFIEKTKNFKV